jgi:hypothetical protein
VKTLLSYTTVLWAFLLLFCLRIVGQLIQTLFPVAWLPPLAAWQGSAIPYGWLLLLQLGIASVMWHAIRRHVSGNVKPHPVAGRRLLAAGTLYFAGMLCRLLVGLADWSDQPWFHKPIPTVFHLVLASFVLLLAGFHLGRTGQKPQENQVPSELMS